MQLLMVETVKNLPVTWKTHIINSMDVSLSKLWEMVKDRKAWCAAVPEVTKRQTQLGD